MSVIKCIYSPVIFFVVNTHYMHSVLEQDCVAYRVCCVNKYHYESRKRRVVMRLVHATGET